LARRGLILNVFIVVAALVCLPVLTCSQRHTIEGTIDHKTVTGVKDNLSYTVLINSPADGEGRILLMDRDYEEYFSTGDENAVVSAPLEAEMKEEYSVLNYLVNVQVGPEEDGTRPFRASREVFNSIEVGTTVKFRWSGPTEFPEIIALLPSSD
jgi:hypothetical protein